MLARYRAQDELRQDGCDNKFVEYAKAISALKLCATDAGMKASGGRVGHHQVWARDSMIALLGARLVPDGQIQTALQASVALLRQKQAPGGAIPNNVDCATHRPNFRAYADAGLWWIVGSSLIAPDPLTVARIVGWYACQDVDQSGLISMQESADWQDLFCTRGKGLYLNCLYVLALRAAGEHERAATVAARINQYFWYEGDGNMQHGKQRSAGFPGSQAMAASEARSDIGAILSAVSRIPRGGRMVRRSG